MGYTYRLLVPLSPEAIFPFFRDLETWFRLNPQWEVLSLKGDGVQQSARFDLSVKYDRSEEEVRYQGTIEEFRDGERLTVRLDAAAPRLITIALDPAGDRGSVISYEETREEESSPEEKRELALWMKSIANYMLLGTKRAVWSRAWKWIVDRLWLKMSPAGRRIVFIVVVSEAAAFLFFILLLVWLLVFKKF